MAMEETTTKALCFTCDIVNEYVSLANLYTQDMSNTLLDPMWMFFGSLAGLWIVIRGLQLGLFMTTPRDVMKEFIFVMIATVLLSGQGPSLINNVYEASLGAMGSMASLALKVGNQTQVSANASQIGSGMEALVRTSEIAITKIFDLAWRIAAAWSITTPLMILYSLILIVPYFILWVAYFAQVVVSIFRIMMLAVFSPFMMLGFAFGWGRDIAKAGIRSLISSFIVLFASTAVIAVLMYALENLNIGEVSTDDDIRAMAEITNPKFMLAVAMGWLGTAFMTEATGLANSITGSALTNNAVATIVGGAAATAVALGKAPGLDGMKGMAGTAGGWAGSTAAHQAGKLAARIPGIDKGVDAGLSIANYIKKMRGY